MIRDARSERKQARERFSHSRKAESAFAKHLRSISRGIDDLVKAFAPNGVVTDPAGLSASLDKYAEALKPWAGRVSQLMLNDVARRDRKAWLEQSKHLGQAFRKELTTEPAGQVLKGMLEEQVSLITSLPREAAERVHKLTTEAIGKGGPRADEIAKEILKTGEVTKARAMTIARTEVARTASNFVEARAKSIGSEAYIWRTAGDSDVRELHKKLEGKTFKWNEPPVIGENGERGHPGTIFNCRCFPEPIIPDEL